MNKWRIASINRTDLEPILAIEQLSFQWPWGHISFEGELSCQNAHNYVVKSAKADNKSQVIAYAFIRRAADELHILKIAVTPAWRRHGIATWLLNRCFTMGTRQGVRSVHLEVRPSNIPAVELYERLGFQEIGCRPNYYADSNEDALLMMKVLAKPVPHTRRHKKKEFVLKGERVSDLVFLSNLRYDLLKTAIIKLYYNLSG